MQANAFKPGYAASWLWSKPRWWFLYGPSLINLLQLALMRFLGNRYFQCHELWFRLWTLRFGWGGGSVENPNCLWAQITLQSILPTPRIFLIWIISYDSTGYLPCVCCRCFAVLCRKPKMAGLERTEGGGLSSPCPTPRKGNYCREWRDTTARRYHFEHCWAWENNWGVLDIGLKIGWAPELPPFDSQRRGRGSASGTTCPVSI